MPLFFFDYRDDEAFVRDSEGTDLSGLEAVKRDAALTLAEMARDALPGSTNKHLSLEVRDEMGAVILVLALNFQMQEMSVISQLNAAIL